MSTGNVLQLQRRDPFTYAIRDTARRRWFIERTGKRCWQLISPFTRSPIYVFETRTEVLEEAARIVSVNVLTHAADKQHNVATAIRSYRNDQA